MYKADGELLFWAYICYPGRSSLMSANIFLIPRPVKGWMHLHCVLAPSRGDTQAWHSIPIFPAAESRFRTLGCAMPGPIPVLHILKLSCSFPSLTLQFLILQTHPLCIPLPLFLFTHSLINSLPPAQLSFIIPRNYSQSQLSPWNSTCLSYTLISWLFLQDLLAISSFTSAARHTLFYCSSPLDILLWRC